MIGLRVLHVRVSSEKAEGALSRRADQLQVILRAMRGERIDCNREVDSIVMGDFNFKNDAEESKAIPADFVDAWLALRPGILNSLSLLIKAHLSTLQMRMASPSTLKLISPPILPARANAQDASTEF